jgi:hypothetical protein
MTLFLAEMFVPIRLAFGNRERLQQLLDGAGWTVSLSTEQAAAVEAVLGIGSLVDDLVGLLDQLDAGELDEAEAISVMATMGPDVLSSVRDLASIDPGDVAGLPAPLDDPNTWAELAVDLPEYLLARWLRLYHPTLAAILELTGVLRTVPRLGRSPRTEIDLGAITQFLGDPGGHLRDVYRWGDGFDHARLVRGLTELTASFGLPAQAHRLLPGTVDEHFGSTPVGLVDEMRAPLWQGYADDSAFVGSSIVVRPVPPLPGSPAVEAFLVAHELVGGATLSAEVLTDVVLTIAAAIEGTAPGVLIGPDGVSATGPQGVMDGSLELAFRPSQPLVLIGSADSTRLELAGGSIRLAVGSTAQGIEVEVDVATDEDGLRLVCRAGDAFLAAVLPGDLTIATSLGIAWSSAQGTVLSGAAGLAVDIPLGLQLGPVRVDSARVALDAGDDGLRGTFTITASGQIGPVSVVVSGIGLGLHALFERGEDPSLEIAFEPPDGVGIAVDLGVVSGGGYLYIDAEAGSYAGVLDLDLLGVGISAVAVVDTKLPDVDGWSMFFALFLDLPSIQLGFGFTLEGVGGVAGINRAIDVDALGSAVRSGALDTILFPENPIVDAPIIIDEFRSIFPPANDSYVFGPIVKIGWGTPTIVEAELGIVIQLPDPVVVVVLGSISAILPTPDTELVALHLDVAGVIDVDAGTLAIDASLHDSHVVGFALAGDMALRAEFGNAQAFLMAVGGFHPRFDPPGDFPTLRRVSFGIGAGSMLTVDFQSYFAITSNSVQCGASFTLDADVAGFGVHGSSGFDALVQFSPFVILTSVEFEVSIRAVGVDLIGVSLYASVEGPNRWHVIGTATFEVLGLKKDIRVDELIGRKESEPPVEAVEVLDDLLLALETDESWTVIEVADPAVTLTESAVPGGPTFATPDSVIELRQTVVPLGIEIEQYANAPIGEHSSFELAVADGAAATSLDDWFAPGRYFELTNTDKLEGPEFELMRSGLRFGGGGPVGGPSVSVDTGYKAYVIDPELDADDHLFNMSVSLLSAAGVSIGANAQSSFTAVLVDVVATTETGYVVVDLDGKTVARTSTWSASYAATTGRSDLHIEREVAGVAS